MSLLRPAVAGRLLKATTSTTRRLTPLLARGVGQTSAGRTTTVEAKEGTNGETALASKVVVGNFVTPFNQLDYGAEVDQASSYDSPDIECST